MDTSYLKDKPSGFILAIWEAMEDMQDAYPHLELGLSGFMFCVIIRL